MFPLAPPPRRPQVPSKAALRVLYQLAYISSGTALGIAALCAEERRRRTKVIQKIADNARLIRQSPRYAHAQALVQDKEEGEAWLPLVGEQARERSKRVRARREGRGEAVRAPELPSVVEREYGASQRRDYKRVRRRGSEESGKAIVQQGNKALYQPPPAAKVRTPDDHTRTARDTMLRQARPVARETGQPENDATRLMKIQDDSPGAWNDASMTSQFSTRHAWRRDPFSNLSMVYNRNAEARVTAEQIKEDVTAFFAWLARNKRELGRTYTARQTGSNLLYLALREGSREDAHELLRWYLDHKTVSETMRNLLIACHTSPLSETPDGRAHLLSTFFSSRAFTQRLPRLRVKLLAVVDIDLSKPQGLPPVFHLALQDIPVGVADDIVEVKCHRLIIEGQLKRAMDMITVFKDRLQSPDKLLDTLTAAGVRPNNVADKWKLLKWRRQHFTVPNHDWDDFVRLCVKEDASSILVELAGLVSRGNKGFGSLEPLDQLCNASYASLVQACVGSGQNLPRHVFSDVYRRLPKEIRSTVLDSSANAACRELQAVWASTRNLRTVTDIALQRISVLETKHSQSSAATLSVRTALIEIWLGAGWVSTARRMLSELHTNGNTDSVVGIGSLAAVVLAKRQEWVSLGKLLDLLCAKEVTFTHPKVKKHFNQVLALYAEDRKPDELYSFATTLIERIGLRHNATASNIVLQAFTEHQRLDLVDEWVEHARLRSHQVRFNDYTAAGMLKAYYLKHRPSHVLMMWFCRALAKSHPSLAGDGAKYVTLVQEAIAYDIRKARGRLVSWKRETAGLRYNRLIDAQDNGAVLNPGFRIGGQIIFPEHRGTGIQVSARESDVSNTEQKLSGIPAIPQATATPEKDDLESQYRLPHNLTLQSAMGRETVAASAAVEAAPQEVEDDHPQDGVSELLAQWDSDEAGGDQFGHSTDNAFSSAPDGDQASPDREQLALMDDTLASLASRKKHDRIASVLEQTANNSVALRLRGTNVSDLAQLERDMILALSDGKHTSVLDLYEKALDAAKLPASPLTLEIAVEASLRLHKGNAQHAEELMQQASDAGFNVSCAAGPLLIHQMSQMGSDHDWADRLVRMTTDYYRLNQENGWPVKHHVAVTAANVLINRHRPLEGLNLLNSIAKSEWAEQKVLPLAAMTVYLNGYAAMLGFGGVKWVVDTVLTTDMRIDSIFLRTLNLAIKGMAAKGGLQKSFDARSMALLRHLYEQCLVRYGQQRREGKLFGKRLVAFLVKHGNQAEGKELSKASHVK